MDAPSVRIISPAFDLLGEIRNYESLQFTRRFYSVGEFELRININKANTDALQNGNLIMLGKDGKKAGIIRHRENEIDENGDSTDTLIIKGPTLKGICSQRIIVPPVDGNGYDSFTGPQETIMKHFVDAHCAGPTDSSRKIPQLVIAEDQGRGVADQWRFRFDNLSDVEEQVGQYAKLGWDVTLDTGGKQLIFDVIQGRNLTAGQDTLPPVIFSTEFSDIKMPHFIQSWLNAVTVGYAGGQGDETDRLIQTVNYHESGDNLISGDPKYWESGHYAPTDGAKADVSTRIRLKDFVKVNPSTTYYFNTHNSSYYFVIRSYDSTGAFASSWGGVGSALTRTTTQNEYYLGIAIYNSGEPGTDTYDGYIAMLQNGTIKPFLCQDSTSGLDRMETFLDCSDAENAAELISKGTQKLAESAPVKTFEFSVVHDHPFVYGTDYDLGDTVTARSKRWGLTMDAQIVELKEIYEAGGNSIEVTFGTSIPSLRKYINHKTYKAVN